MLSLTSIVQHHKRQFEADPLTADPSLLQTGINLLHKHLQSFSLDAEVVHQGEYLYYQLGEKEAVVALLTRYLSQTLLREEEAWARWNLVDYMAMLRRCEEAVQAQKDFLAWAEENLSIDRLLWVMSDGTQMLCWWQSGQAEAWLNIFESVMQRIQATADNRFERHLYLRTAGELLCRLNRPDEALLVAEKMQALSQEAGDWERSMEVQVAAYALQVAAYQALQNKEALCRIGILAKDHLLKSADDLSDMTAFQRQRLAVMCGNMAAVLYRAQQYALSIPLHQQAIAIGTSSEHAYLWLAAALWATTKSRPQVFVLLRRGAILGHARGFTHWGVPEFVDVKDDPEFIEVVASAAL